MRTHQNTLPEKMPTQYAFDFDRIRLPSLKLAFRSGMSRTKDFWAAADAGVPVGVVATELTFSQVLIGLPRCLRDGGHIFIDSGAFAELATGVEPDFDRVMRVYESLADGIGIGFNAARLYVVAPDKVGDQLVTLERLAKYADRVRALIEAGCKVIVPIQRGVIPAAEMLARAVAVLGTDRFVAGIPSNKEAMSLAECATLKHHAYHILGRVQMNQEQIERLQALTQGNSDAEITADANWLRSRLAVVSEIAERERLARAAEPRGQREHFRPSARAVAIKTALQHESTWGVPA